MSEQVQGKTGELASAKTKEKISRDGTSTVAVTGATGFIGSRLVEHLAGMGYPVRGISRRDIPDRQNMQFVRADAFDVSQMEHALQGAKVAFYLLHSMEGDKGHWKDFAAREKVQAQNFLTAATNAGVGRIIYLGGLVNGSLGLSPHMKSRKDVGAILASGKIPVTELRASLIIGAQGGSYAMLRYLVERLPVMVCPSWVKSVAQPISVDDVIGYLAGCMENGATSGNVYEIGGRDKMTYEQIMRVYAKYLGKRLFVIQIPFLTTRLSSYWVDLVTPVRASLARPLIDSLVHDTVVNDDSLSEIVPLRRKSVLESIDRATVEMRKNPPSVPLREERTGFRINQKLLLVSLVAMGIVGTTYYWMDDRAELLHPVWVLLGVLWYATLFAAIAFVKSKTRLGYLIGGLLSWATLAFWLFDNAFVILDVTLVYERPSQMIAARNFVWAALSMLAVVASHNTFHKIIDYQFRGKPV